MLISKRQAFYNRSLVVDVQKEVKSYGDFLVLIQKQVLKLYLLQQTISIPEVGHEFHYVHQKIGDLEVTQSFSFFNQVLQRAFIPLGNNKNGVGDSDDLNNRRYDLGIERAVQLQHLLKMLIQGIHLQNRPREI